MNFWEVVADCTLKRLESSFFIKNEIIIICNFCYSQGEILSTPEFMSWIQVTSKVLKRNAHPPSLNPSMISPAYQYLRVGSWIHQHSWAEFTKYASDSTDSHRPLPHVFNIPAIASKQDSRSHLGTKKSTL